MYIFMICVCVCVGGGGYIVYIFMIFVCVCVCVCSRKFVLTVFCSSLCDGLCAPIWRNSTQKSILLLMLLLLLLLLLLDTVATHYGVVCDVTDTKCGHKIAALTHSRIFATLNMTKIFF